VDRAGDADLGGDLGRDAVRDFGDRIYILRFLLGVAERGFSQG